MFFISDTVLTHLPKFNMGVFIFSISFTISLALSFTFLNTRNIILIAVLMSLLLFPSSLVISGSFKLTNSSFSYKLLLSRFFYMPGNFSYQLMDILYFTHLAARFCYTLSNCIEFCSGISSICFQGTCKALSLRWYNLLQTLSYALSSLSTVACRNMNY